jgi:sRNA-binding carbon storage regulator CsrA
MLVLQRRVKSWIVLEMHGQEICRFQIARISAGDRIRIAFDAVKELRIIRGEFCNVNGPVNNLEKQ